MDPQADDRRQTLQYVRDMLLQLKGVLQQPQRSILSYLIDMARVEAEEQIAKLGTEAGRSEGASKDQ